MSVVKRHLTFIAFFCILCSSCATMMDGSKTKVYVNEGNPKGISVYLNNQFIGYTPCAVYVPKKLASEGTSSIELRKEGYRTETISLTRKVQTGYIIADVLLLVFPLFIDLATGNYYKVQPEFISPKLREKN